MAIALLILLGEAALAFLALDLLLRYAPMGDEGRWQGCYKTMYGALGGLVCLAGVGLGWRYGGFPGSALAAPGPMIWWVLWRFGLRKQLTHLFAAGGKAKPDR